MPTSCIEYPKAIKGTKHEYYVIVFPDKIQFFTLKEDPILFTGTINPLMIIGV